MTDRGKDQSPPQGCLQGRGDVFPPLRQPEKEQDTHPIPRVLERDVYPT